MIPGSLGRYWRTARYLRPRQLWGQLRQRFDAGVQPFAYTGELPHLAFREPLVPFLPSPPHAFFDGEHCFYLLNQQVTFPKGVDWEYAEAGPLWSYHQHQFDYLRHPALESCARRRLILDWIERHVLGCGWAPHPLGLRAIAWTKLLLTEGVLDLSAADAAVVHRSLASQLLTLQARLETHLLANHYLSNLLALVFAGLCFEGEVADVWLRSAVEPLAAELNEQILPDGAHFERSPMYHSLLLENILDCVNAAKVAKRAPEHLLEQLADAAARMLGALAIFTHPDGQIALFSDSAFGVAAAPEDLCEYAAALGMELRGPARAGLLDGAGFARLEEAPFSLIASLAGPMPSYQPGHAHCDALAFELCVGDQRIVTDTGVAEYVPGALRDQSRATRSHATLEIDGCEQAEWWAAHRVAGRPRVELLSCEPGRRAAGACTSFATPRVRHLREFEVSCDGVLLRDHLAGHTRSVRMTLPLAPGLTPQLQGACAKVLLRGGWHLVFQLPEALAWRVEELPYFPEFGRVLSRSVLVGEASGFECVETRIMLDATAIDGSQDAAPR